MPLKIENKNPEMLNLEKLLQHFDQDLELLQQVAYEFRKESPHYLQQLIKACENKDWLLASNSSNKIHGASANFGGNHVTTVARQIEVLIQRKQSRGMPALLKFLETELSKLCTELEVILEKKAS